MAARGLVLVTGGTGKQGGAVARELLAAGRAVRIMTRKPDSPAARELAQLGAEIVQGDLDDAASLPAALDGAWGTYAVQNTWEAGVVREEAQGLRFADAARKAGVTHYVYASVGSAHRETGIPHFENKFRIEERVRSLGFPSWVILRPAFFMENLLAPNALTEIESGKLLLGIKPTTRLQMIAVADVGKYGALAFQEPDRLANRAIDIASDELTPVHAAGLLSEVTGHAVEFVQIPIEAIRKVSEDLAVMNTWFDDVGYNADISGNAREFGIPPTSFAEWAKTQWALSFRA